MKFIIYCLFFICGFIGGAIYMEGRTDGDKTSNKDALPNPMYTRLKVKIIENGSITYVNTLTRERSGVAFPYYQPNDTVWVNLTTHAIDDLDSNAMLGVIIKE